MSIARIMIAETEKGSAIAASSLEGYELVTVHDLKSAQYQVLEDGIDLFLLGIHFDDSRATELVNFIRSDDKHKTTPIIVTRTMTTARADLLRTAVRALMKVGSVNLYLELAGNPDVQTKIRQAVDLLLPAEKKLSSRV